MSCTDHSVHRSTFIDSSHLENTHTSISRYQITNTSTDLTTHHAAGCINRITHFQHIVLKLISQHIATAHMECPKLTCSDLISHTTYNNYANEGNSCANDTQRYAMADTNTLALGFTYAHKGYHRIDRISHQSHTRSLHKATPAQVTWQPVSIVIECLVMQITSNVLKEHYIAFVHDLQILRICLTWSDAHRPHTRSSHTQRYYASGTDYFRQQVSIVVRYHPSASVSPHCDCSCIVSEDYMLRLG